MATNCMSLIVETTWQIQIWLRRKTLKVLNSLQKHLESRYSKLLHAEQITEA